MNGARHGVRYVDGALPRSPPVARHISLLTSTAHDVAIDSTNDAAVYFRGVIHAGFGTPHVLECLWWLARIKQGLLVISANLQVNRSE